MGLSLKKVFKTIATPFTLPVELGAKYLKDIKDHPEHVADRQRQAELEAWNMQNEYNTPANQVQRLRDAGLNPNLFYNMGDTGNAKSAPEFSTYDQGEMINSLFGYAFQAMQLINAQKAMNMQAERQMFQQEYQKDVLDFQKHQFAVEQAYRQIRGEQWQKDFDERVRHNKVMESQPRGGLYGLIERGLGAFMGKPVTDVISDTGNFVRNIDIDKPAENTYSVGHLLKPALVHWLRGLQTYGRNMRMRGG